MSLFRIFKNRFNILYILIVLIVVVLVFRLATLTIVEGDYYKDIADVKMIRDIPVKAPRGKIYDKNGVILADNLTSFTVQIYKSDIEYENLDNVFYELTKIISENSEKLIDEFPIVLNIFEYVDTSNTGLTATEFVLETLYNNDLLDELLDESYDGNNNYFTFKEKIHNFLLGEFELYPIELKNGKFEYAGSEDEVLDFLEKNYELLDELEGEFEDVEKEFTEITLPDAEHVILHILETEDRLMHSLLSDAQNRKLTYDFFVKKGLSQDLELIEFAFLQDIEYEELKHDLSENYTGISETSTAKEDFLFLCKYVSFDQFFSSIYVDDDANIIPGEIMLEYLKTLHSNLPVEIEIDLENNTILYKYIDDEIKNTFLNELSFSEEISAFELFKVLAFNEADMLDKIIEENAYFAQVELLNAGVNPEISVSSWQYTSLRNKHTWIEANVTREGIEEVTAEEAFNFLKAELDIIDNNGNNIVNEIDDYHIRNVLTVKDRYNKQGYLSYHPIDISYDISEKTVAIIAERNHELTGVDIKIEPIRYYPKEAEAAHILGYLGKISQESEINEYLVEQDDKYSLDDIIGKTGIEEKYEEYLAGDKGKTTVAVNASGNAIQSVSEVAPIPGDDVYLTIDSRLQQVVEETLKKGVEAIQVGGIFESEWGDYKYTDVYENATSASMVVIDVNNGEILAMANYPSYDLNLFATGISAEDYNSLLNDSTDQLAPRPLYNTAMLTAIQPGSTFKMVTSLAALEKGIDPRTTVYCSGRMELGGRHFGCWIYNLYGGAHGSQNMYQAIGNSCNFYYYVTMLGENPVTGTQHPIQLDVEDITDMAIEFGLNDPTGIEIDIPREISGGVPVVEAKKSTQRLYLRLFLEEDTQQYIIDGYDMSQEEMDEAVNTIVGWINDDIMTRSEVYQGLLDLNFDPEKPDEYGTPLVDVIKYSYINHSVWNAGDSLNISIGQGQNAYSPLQMANYVAMIANGGKRFNVNVVDKISSYDGFSTIELENEYELMKLNDFSNFDVLKEGMKLVANDYIPYSEKFPAEVAIKTGTAQHTGINPETGEPYDDFAWMVGFAPYEEPQIAISCVIFQGGSGVYPAPLVKEVMAEYLALEGLLERP